MYAVCVTTTTVNIPHCTQDVPDYPDPSPLTLPDLWLLPVFHYPNYCKLLHVACCMVWVDHGLTSYPSKNICIIYSF